MWTDLGSGAGCPEQVSCISLISAGSVQKSFKEAHCERTLLRSVVHGGTCVGKNVICENVRYPDTFGRLSPRQVLHAGALGGDKHCYKAV